MCPVEDRDKTDLARMEMLFRNLKIDFQIIKVGSENIISIGDGEYSSEFYFDSVGKYLKHSAGY